MAGIRRVLRKATGVLIMNLAALTYNWFDLVVVATLAIGVLRGRSRGMSQELLDVLKWLVIVVVGGLVYQPVGKFLADNTHISATLGYVTAYLAVVILLRVLFGWIKHLTGEKLVGSDVFGDWEYYFGMMAGAVRFACYLIVAMSLLNARYISPEQMAADARMQQENFGDISFPTMGRMQQTVFGGSASGQFVKKYLGHELIASAPGDKNNSQAENFRSQRERAIYEVLGEKR
jgi:uncharacterized membrane protein required for colicin V production